MLRYRDTRLTGGGRSRVPYLKCFDCGLSVRSRSPVTDPHFCPRCWPAASGARSGSRRQSLGGRQMVNGLRCDALVLAPRFPIGVADGTSPPAGSVVVAAGCRCAGAGQGAKKRLAQEGGGVSVAALGPANVHQAPSGLEWWASAAVATANVPAISRLSDRWPFAAVTRDGGKRPSHAAAGALLDVCRPRTSRHPHRAQRGQEREPAPAGGLPRARTTAPTKRAALRCRRFWKQHDHRGLRDCVARSVAANVPTLSDPPPAAPPVESIV